MLLSMDEITHPTGSVQPPTLPLIAELPPPPLVVALLLLPLLLLLALEVVVLVVGRVVLLEGLELARVQQVAAIPEALCQRRKRAVPRAEHALHIAP